MSIQVVSVGYEFFGNHDSSWGGFTQTLEQAQQECQGVALGPLHWEQGSFRVWEAVDPETQTVFEISALEY
ncbi:hypothetical protein [Deinococcus sp. UYEF24]